MRRWNAFLTSATVADAASAYAILFLRCLTLSMNQIRLRSTESIKLITTKSWSSVFYATYALKPSAPTSRPMSGPLIFPT